jgi:hypothetical protein
LNRRWLKYQTFPIYPLNKCLANKRVPIKELLNQELLVLAKVLRTANIISKVKADRLIKDVVLNVARIKAKVLLSGKQERGVEYAVKLADKTVKEGA